MAREYPTDVVIRTWDDHREDPEGDYLVQRIVREPVEYRWIIDAQGFWMESGWIRFRGHAATVNRWISPDGTYATTWTTEGALVNHREYREVKSPA